LVVANDGLAVSGCKRAFPVRQDRRDAKFVLGNRYPEELERLTER
jgi:hypothetical protein